MLFCKAEFVLNMTICPTLIRTVYKNILLFCFILNDNTLHLFLFYFTFYIYFTFKLLFAFICCTQYLLNILIIYYLLILALKYMFIC